MCPPFGYRCRFGTCIPGNPLSGCETAPIGGCQNCNIALIATQNTMIEVTLGDWRAPAGHMRGYVVPGLGWVIIDPGASSLQSDDVVLTIAEKGGYPEPVNSAWFAQHWEDLNLPPDKQPTEFTLTFWRSPWRQLQSVTVSRV